VIFSEGLESDWPSQRSLSPTGSPLWGNRLFFFRCPIWSSCLLVGSVTSLVKMSLRVDGARSVALIAAIGQSRYLLAVTLGPRPAKGNMRATMNATGRSGYRATHPLRDPPPGAGLSQNGRSTGMPVLDLPIDGGAVPWADGAELSGRRLALAIVVIATT